MALKGIGYKSDSAENLRRILSLNPKWWYNWGQTRGDFATMSNSPEFVPMLFSDKQSRLDAFAADLRALRIEVPKTVTAILGPNEPDWQNETDGPPNMTPLEVLNIWKTIQDAGYLLRKGSPANMSTNRVWQDQFMGAQKALDIGTQSWERNFEVNFMATHIYSNPDVGSWLKKCDVLYEKFGKPVWVTETCVHDFSATTIAENRYSRAQVNEFMLGIWEGAKSRPWLERIAWHTRAITDPVGSTGALFNEDGSLTSTGILWRDIDKVS